MDFEGEVFSGMNVGEEYIGLKPYQDKISEITGFRPFPGTLNIKIDPEKFEEMRNCFDSERISSFEYQGVSYSGLNVYKARLEGFKVAIVDIDVTDYDSSVLEVIASVKLRKKLDLDDGDAVEIEILR